MGLLQDARNVWKNLKQISQNKDVASSSQLPDIGYYQGWNGVGIQPPRSSSAELENYQSWIYIAVSKIAQEMSNIHLRLYKRGGQDSSKEITKHPALDILDRANEGQTFADLMETTFTYYGLTGEAFWWLQESKDGSPFTIFPYLRPDRMEVIPGKETLVSGYKYRVIGSGDSVSYRSDEIIHFKSTNPLNPYRGLSPIAAGEYAVSLHNAGKEYNYGFFKNDASPNVTLETDKPLTEVQIRQMKEMWEGQFRGNHNKGKTAILHGGLKVNQFGTTQKDMQFIEQQNLTRDEILAIYKVPLAVINPPDLTNRATAETARAIFLDQVITPLMNKFVRTLNEFYLPMFGDDSLYFEFDHPTPPDDAAQLLFYQNGLTYGWLAPNEVRIMEGLPVVDGGWSLYTPATAVPGPEVDPNSVQQSKQVKHIFPKRTESEIDKELVLKKLSSKESIEALASLTTGVVKGMNSFEKKGDAFWKKLISRTTREEALVRNKMITEFTRQKNAVLKSLKSTGSFNFDLEKENQKLEEKMSPVMEDIVTGHYIDAEQQVARSKSIKTPTEDVIYQLLVNGLKWIVGVNETTKEDLQIQLTAGLELGESIDKLKARVKKVFLEATASRAEMIARTEVLKAANSAANEAYIESGVVEAKKWYTALDERVDEEICAPMHGEEVPIESHFTLPDGDQVTVPTEAHPQCRCTIIPITKSLR